MDSLRCGWASGKQGLVFVALLGACGGSAQNDLFGPGPATGAAASAGSGVGGSGGWTTGGGGPSSGGGGLSSGAQGGVAQGGNAFGGTAGTAIGGSAPVPGGAGGQSGGGPSGGQSGGGGEGGVPACADTEICDGVDNDCDDVIDGEGVCPAGCHGFAKDGDGYMICEPSGDTLVSWVDASDECSTHADSMQLVSIESEAENEWLLAQALKLDFEPNSLWIGATDDDDEGQWYWLTGTHFFDDDAGTAVDSAYENWALYQPTNTGGAEHCAAMTIALTALAGTWHDRACHNPDDAMFGFICEVSK